MNRALRRWAKANGFSYDRRRGAWLDAEGRMLAEIFGRWRVLTRGGGFHPTIQPPGVAS